MNSRSFAFLTTIVLAACDRTPDDNSPRWVRVARDANYIIYIDTGRRRPYDALKERGRRLYEVWYRTDHAIPRVHESDKKLFNREVVHSIINCDDLTFRVAGVDMSMRGERVFVQQRLTLKELQFQKPRHVA